MCLSPGTPRLPPELILHIIDLLQYDRRTLSSCSLVSKSWVHQSRRYLLRDAKIHLPEPGSPSEKTALDPFISCIKESVTIPDIGPPFFKYICALTIGHFTMECMFRPGGPKLTRMEIVPLMDVLRSLPHLKVLDIALTRFVTSEPVPALKSPVLSLEELSLCCNVWNDLDGGDGAADLAFWSLFKSIDCVCFGPLSCDTPTHTSSQVIEQAVLPLERRNTIKVPRFAFDNWNGPGWRRGIRILEQVIDFASVTKLTVTGNVTFEQGPAPEDFIDKCPNVEWIDATLEASELCDSEIPHWMTPILSHPAFKSLSMETTVNEEVGTNEIYLEDLAWTIYNLAEFCTSLQSVEISVFHPRLQLQLDKPTHITWLEALVEPFELLARVCKIRLEANIFFDFMSMDLETGDCADADNNKKHRERITEVFSDANVALRSTVYSQNLRIDPPLP